MKLLVASILVCTSLVSVNSQAAICDRSDVVQDSITEAIRDLSGSRSKKSCYDIDENDLHKLESISLVNRKKGQRLKRADFVGLTNLKAVNFYLSHPLAFPDDVFLDLPNLTKAYYSGRGDGLSIVSAAVQLEDVRIELDDGNYIYDPELRKIRGSDFLKLKKLKRLKMTSRIAHNDWAPYELVSLPFDQCSTLEEFDLARIKVPKDLELLAEATRIGECHGSSQPTLKTLSLSNLHSTDALRSDNLSLNSAISELSIRYGAVPNLNQLISNLPALTNLKTWSRLYFEPAGKNVDFRIAGHPRLESVEILNADGDQSFADLPRLKNLLFSGDLNTHFYGNIDLVNLPSLARLRFRSEAFVNLSFNKVNWTQEFDLTSLSLVSIPRFYEMSGIKKIDLRKNDITDVPLDYGATLPADLEELDICDNPLRNPQALWNLTKGYPAGARFKIKVSTAHGCESLN